MPEPSHSMTIDIAFCINSRILPGMLAAMNSILRNSHNGRALRFSILAPDAERDLFQKVLARVFPQVSWRVGSLVPPAPARAYFARRNGGLCQRDTDGRNMAFARLYLHRAFPDLRKTIYLDADVIVLGDVAELHDAARLGPDMPLAAVPNPPFMRIGLFRKPLKALSELRAIRAPFNSGVLVTDCALWHGPIEACIHHYMAWDASFEGFMFNLGDETLLNLVFKRYFPLDRRWNNNGYGNSPMVARMLQLLPGERSIIHWSGHRRKPWSDASVPFQDIWRRYDVSPDVADLLAA